MNKKNITSMVFLLILIKFCFRNCNCEEEVYWQQSDSKKSKVVITPQNHPNFADMCDLHVIHKLVANSKCADVLDDELIKILVVYSILKSIPSKDVEKFLLAARSVDSSNKIGFLNFEDAALDKKTANSNETSPILSSGEHFMIFLACLAVFACCAVYAYKEYEQAMEREEFILHLQKTFRGVEDFRNKIRQGVNNAFYRLRSLW